MRERSVEVPVDDNGRSAVEACGFAEREVLALDAAGDGVALLVETDSGTMLGDWRAARTAVDETGRWPLLIASWSSARSAWRQAFLDAVPFSRFYFKEGSHGGDAALPAYGGVPTSSTSRRAWRSGRITWAPTGGTNPAMS